MRLRAAGLFLGRLGLCSYDTMTLDWHAQWGKGLEANLDQPVLFLKSEQYFLKQNGKLFCVYSQSYITQGQESIPSYYLVQEPEIVLDSVLIL